MKTFKDLNTMTIEELGARIEQLCQRLNAGADSADSPMPMTRRDLVEATQALMRRYMGGAK